MRLAERHKAVVSSRKECRAIADTLMLSLAEALDKVPELHIERVIQMVESDLQSLKGSLAKKAEALAHKP